MSWGWTGYGHARCRRYVPRRGELPLQASIQLGQRNPQRLGQPEVTGQGARRLATFNPGNRRRIHARGRRQIDEPQLLGAAQGASACSQQTGEAALAVPEV